MLIAPELKFDLFLDTFECEFINYIGLFHKGMGGQFIFIEGKWVPLIIRGPYWDRHTVNILLLAGHQFHIHNHFFIGNIPYYWNLLQLVLTVLMADCGWVVLHYHHKSRK